jgi:N-acetylglucosaminyl-diphospho-decaprenol L-rhamnosyltransferase
VVVATRDRRTQLEPTLRLLTELPERPPVIVVDNGSTDGTADTAARVPGVQVIRLTSNLGAAARTLGVRAAATPYVAFADDDSWWAPGSLDRAAQLLDGAPQLGLLAGRIVIEPGGVDDPACAAMAAGPPSRALPGGCDVLGFIACGAVVRREAYLAVGGFHRRFGIGGEEDLLALDLTTRGWGCGYHAGVLAHHRPSHDRPRAGRARRETRNALWTAWLRRRPAGALRRSGDVVLRRWRAPTTWAGLVEAAAGLPWVLAERSAVDPVTERWRAALDRGERWPQTRVDNAAAGRGASESLGAAVVAKDRAAGGN